MQIADQPTLPTFYLTAIDWIIIQREAADWIQELGRDHA
jgi:hypothetical protein